MANAPEAHTVEALKPAPYNPRKIKPEALDNLGESMQEFGDLSGVVRNVRTDRLVCGHQRHKKLDPAWKIEKQAAKDKTGTVSLGYIVTPWGLFNYREVDWDDAKEHAANISANKLRSEWDKGPLKSQLVDLDTGGRYLELTGYTHLELKKLIDFEPPASPLEDVPPAPKTPITKAGELWELGAHRLLCGDSFDPEDVGRLMGKAKAAMVATDPPYAIYGSSTGVSSDTVDDKMVRPFFENLGKTILSLIPEFGHAYVCCDWRSWASVWEGFKRAGLAPKNMLVWDKGGAGLGNNYANTHELVGFFSRMPTQKAMSSSRKAGQRAVLRPNILRYPRVPGVEREHNAAKPVDLMQELLKNSSDTGAVVVDLFGGSGSTLIAAENCGRVCRLMEMEPRMCDVIIRRWENLTKKKAKRLKTNEA